MMLHQLHVIREDDNIYRILDAHGREPGSIVRHILDNGVKQFRAFGTDYSTLGDAVAEFVKIPWVRQCDMGLDDIEKVLR